MGSLKLQKWKRSFAKRHDRVVRLLKMPHLAMLNQDYETSLRRWRQDQNENKLRYEYDLTAEDIVFDLGGFEGSWSAEISARYGCQIHVFEPVPKYHQAISDRFVRNQRIHPHQFGLSNANYKTSLSIQGDSSSQWKKSADQIEIQLRDATEFIEQLNEQKISLCKINIEGGEYEFLERLLDSKLVDRFENLQIQFHTFVPDATERMEAIQRRLELTHELTYQYRFVWENWRLRSQSSVAA